jgi:hypothetical protein
MCVLGMSEELKQHKIAVNALWPKKLIFTAAIERFMGEEGLKYSRKPEIMADAAYAILIRDPTAFSGQFYIDEEVLNAYGMHELKSYACDEKFNDEIIDLSDWIEKITENKK